MKIQALFGSMSLALSLMMSSCAQKVWVKAGATDVDFQRDLAEAEYNARAATVGGFNSYSSPFLNSNQRMGESMANGVTRALEEQKLIAMFLKMRGWHLETVTAPSRATNQPSHQQTPTVSEQRTREPDRSIQPTHKDNSNDLQSRLKQVREMRDSMVKTHGQTLYLQ